MAGLFDIVLSKPLDSSDIATGFADLIPAGLRVDVRRDLSEFPDDSAGDRVVRQQVRVWWGCRTQAPGDRQ